MLHEDLFGTYRRPCARFVRRALEFLASRPDITTIVLNARWTYNLERTWFDNGEGGVEPGPRDTPVTARDQQRMANDLAEVVKRLLALGRRVILVNPVPEPGWDVPVYMVKAWARGRDVPDTFGPRAAIVAARARSAYRALDSIDPSPRLIRLEPAARLCSRGGRCRMKRKMVPFYFDTNHLTPAGAREALPLAYLQRAIPQ
jgi:hypothetical protein